MEAGLIPELTPSRRRLRWWAHRADLVWRLENPSLALDATITRLRPPDITGNPQLRLFVIAFGGEPWDILGWQSHADGPFGRYRLVALFLQRPGEEERPVISSDPLRDPRGRDDPCVLCLDGPRDSKHRNQPAELCLYVPNDPEERRWTFDGGLVRLFDLARQHVAAEDIWRARGRVRWPMDEAPHGWTHPTRPKPALRLPPLEIPVPAR